MVRHQCLTPSVSCWPGGPWIAGLRRASKSHAPVVQVRQLGGSLCVGETSTAGHGRRVQRNLECPCVDQFSSAVARVDPVWALVQNRTPSRPSPHTLHTAHLHIAPHTPRGEPHNPPLCHLAMCALKTHNTHNTHNRQREGRCRTAWHLIFQGEPHGFESTSPHHQRDRDGQLQAGQTASLGTCLPVASHDHGLDELSRDACMTVCALG